jgi:hypothetical protein
MYDKTNKIKKSSKILTTMQGQWCYTQGTKNTIVKGRKSSKQCYTNEKKTRNYIYEYKRG